MIEIEKKREGIREGIKKALDPAGNADEELLDRDAKAVLGSLHSQGVVIHTNNQEIIPGVFVPAIEPLIEG